MLTLKTLYWSNCFSYGPDNEISLNSSRVTQLIGANGHGKSSIPLILQEVLYNKNSKGTKKADVPNRNLPGTPYSIAIDFDLDGSEYFFSIVRKGATTKTELLQNGEDIGAHTATATYKQVAELLGMDFTTFCQLVYQSANSSLEFLTATDTTRKKFLISLLNLGEYSEEENLIKKVFGSANLKLAAAESSVETITAWLDKNLTISTETKELVEVLEQPNSEREELANLKHAVLNANTTNAKVKKYKSDLDKLEQVRKKVAFGRPPDPEVSLNEVMEKKGKVQAIKSNALSMRKKMLDLGDSCPTCLSKVDTTWVQQTLATQSNILEKCTEKEADLMELQQKAELLLVDIKAFESYSRELDRLEKSIDDSVTEEVSVDDVSSKISAMQSKIRNVEEAIKSSEELNRAATSHNDNIKFIIEQTDKYKEELSVRSAELEVLQRQVARLGILKRAFSTKGLVAYKIEAMIKDLEVLINKYLVEMSDGRFSLAFVVAGDKLNVDILDGSSSISISALSSGELARVNIATLLAIRKLMNTLSNTKLNLLFLDEVTSVLDEEGRERLVEVLNKETDINAFIVSHGWQHPLVDRVDVVKTDKISKVVY